MFLFFFILLSIVAASGNWVSAAGEGTCPLPLQPNGKQTQELKLQEAIDRALKMHKNRLKPRLMLSTPSVADGTSQSGAQASRKAAALERDREALTHTSVEQQRSSYAVIQHPDGQHSIG